MPKLLTAENAEVAEKAKKWLCVAQFVNVVERAMFSCCHEGNLRVSNAKRGGHDEMPLRGDVIAMGVGDPFDEGSAPYAALA